MKIIGKKNHLHRRNGSSLILVTLIGTIATILAMAVLGSLLDVYRHLAHQIGTQQVASSAESGMQYTIAFVNSMKDDLEALPSTLDIPSGMTGGVNVQATIEDVDKSTLAALSAPFYLAESPVQVYKRITINASNGSDKSKIVAMLGPDIFDGKLPNGSQPLFQGALHGGTSVTLNSGSSVMADGSPNYSSVLVSSKNGLNLNGNNHIQGSVNSLGSISANPSVTVDGNVHASGAITNNSGPLAPFTSDALLPPLNLPNPLANVLGDGVNGNSFGAIDSTVTNTTYVPAPTPSTSGPPQIDSPSSTSITVSPPEVNGSPDLTGVYDLGSVNLSSGQTLTLKPGNYSATSFNMGSGSTVQIDTSGSSSNGVKLFIQDNSAGDTAVSIGENGSTFNNSGSANSFQVFYNGNKNISIQTSPSNPFTGLVYAPNSNLNVKSSSPSQLNGAFVANNLNIANSVTVNFNSNATNTTSGGGVSAPGYDPTTLTKFNLKVLSWQEIPKNQIP